LLKYSVIICKNLFLDGRILQQKEERLKKVETQ